MKRAYFTDETSSPLNVVCTTANPRVASAQAMATAVVKRPINQQSTTSMPPLPPATAGKDLSRPVSAVPPTGGPSSESWSEYSHYNSKLTIENFDLLKVKKLDM